MHLPTQPTTVPAASGGLPADVVQHDGEPFHIMRRNDTTGVM